MVTMLDSVNVENLPHDPGYWYAGYVNGAWPTFEELRKRFPRNTCVSITVTAERIANVLDVERGDATPSDVPRWCEKMRRLGTVPIVYCRRGSLRRWKRSSPLVGCRLDERGPPSSGLARYSVGRRN